MRKSPVLFAGVVGLVLGSFVVAACVGDEPFSGPTGSGTRGMLDNQCFENGTCNPGLSCNVVQGLAKCVVPGDASVVVGDASSVTDAGTQPIADAAPSTCVFTPTTYPCAKGMPPMTCFGAASSCTATGCNPEDQQWGCFSQRQCNDVNPCCVKPASGTLEAGVACAQGTLKMMPEAGTGAMCSNSLSCAADETRLCQADSHCPPGQRCSPIKVTGGPVALDGKVYLGACVP